jgi:hypothetical protein
MASFFQSLGGDLATTKSVPSPIFVDPPLCRLSLIPGTPNLVTLISA